MKSNDVREKFLSYFEKNKHTRVDSSRLVPEGDPTLLFTNAGMNQFKNVFLGLETRDYNRATTSQKCVRAGGKHNDLENVGFTARHHTFFEMLGNFSFGDYFKKDAIHFAWQLVVTELGLPKDRLYVTVFETDDEAADLWHKQEGVPKDRIFRFGEKDNFWRMGSSGPCGPCSELFFDMDPNGKGTPYQNILDGTDRVIEFWNLVFMQYNETEDGKKTPLPKPSVDTGAGLERMSTILQGKTSNYDNDLFQTLIGRAEKESGIEYVREFKKISGSEREALESQNVAMRVMADHARAASFLIADGILPSNEGRGYVLRRILRRALRYGKKLSERNSLLPSVMDEVIEQMGAAYPELEKQKKMILSTARDEEKRFFITLDQGTELLQNEMDRLKNSGQTTLSGQFSFKLYDTFGFPIDLTRLMAKESRLAIDEAAFEKHLQDSKQIAKASWKGKGLSGSEAHLIQLSQSILKKSGPTQFTGYGTGLGEGKILVLSDGKAVVQELKVEQNGFIIFDKTCFYAEGGGQIGDTGQILTPAGEAEVLDCTKINEQYIHHIRVVDGVIKNTDPCKQLVTSSLRRSTANNHSATHLLHAALRKVLGSHVIQAGSLVEPNKLRFDFTHNKSLTPEELSQIELLVNREIAAAHQVETSVMTPKDAAAAGALALFGEKYGDRVRVLKMGDFSMELCGGTHVSNTAEIRVLKIVSEGGVSSGVRRIEAITGDTAIQYLQKNTHENLAARSASNLQENWQVYLSEESKAATPAQFIEKTKEEIKTLQKEIQTLKGSKVNVESLIQSGKEFSAQGQKGRLIFADLEIDDRNLLSQISDRMRDKIGSGVVIIVGRGSDSHPIIVSVSKNLVGPLNAGKILAEVAAIMGGKGGGRPDFAQGAGRDLTKISEAKIKSHSMVGV